VAQSRLDIARKRNVAVPAGKQTPFFQCTVRGNNDRIIIDASQ
jgi:hypothetical protein